MRPSHQPDLFADPAADASAAALVAVTTGQAPLSKDHRAFNRLTERLRIMRVELTRWTELEARLHHRIGTELAAAEAEVRDAQRRLVRRLDELLSGTARTDRLSRRHRHAVREHLLMLAGHILAAGPDPEIETLHDRHAGVSRAQLERGELEEAEALIGALLGQDAVDGNDADTVEELLEHARDRLEAKERARAERKARRAARPGARRTRAELAAERKAQARGEALRSIRDIYRKLASALHPDRESDARERERKTVLMQRVNQAYERDDVLELLALQVEVEQLDVAQLAGTPAERIRHYNEIMKEQLAALESELAGLQAPLRVALDLPSGKLTPREVERALDASVGEAYRIARIIEADLARLDDRRERRALLDELLEEHEGSVPPDDVLLALLGNPFAPPGLASRPRAGKPRRKRR